MSSSSRTDAGDRPGAPVRDRRHRGGQRRLDYDQLVYAIGSTTSTTGVPGADEHAHSLNSPQSASAFASRLDELDPGGVVVVGGNGLTGIEAATEIAESTLPASRPARARPTGLDDGTEGRAYLDQALAPLGIEVRSGVLITKVLPDEVELDGGEIVRSDATLWTTGFWASPLAGEAGLAVDARGRVVVDATLRSVSHPTVFAIGDAAAIRLAWGEIHGTCQSGIPSGARGRQHRPPGPEQEAQALPIRLLAPAAEPGPQRCGDPVHQARRHAPPPLDQGLPGRRLQGARHVEPPHDVPHRPPLELPAGAAVRPGRSGHPARRPRRSASDARRPAARVEAVARTSAGVRRVTGVRPRSSPRGASLVVRTSSRQPFGLELGGGPAQRCPRHHRSDVTSCAAVPVVGSVPTGPTRPCTGGRASWCGGRPR